jgi:hypothetical protein
MALEILLAFVPSFPAFTGWANLCRACGAEERDSGAGRHFSRENLRVVLVW